MRKMRIKRYKKNKLYVYFVFFAFLCFSINFNLKGRNFDSNNSEFVNKLLSTSNSYLVAEESNNDIVYELMGTLNNIEIENPVLMLNKVFAYEEDIEIPNTLEFSYIQNTIVDNPRVYIYSTHPSEGYSGSDFNVVDASLILQERLNSIGIQTIVEPRNVDTFIKQNSSIKDSYSASRIFLKDALSEYDFDLIIDLHRDQVPSSLSTKVTINGKKYAKVMFVMNQKYSNNYALAEKINKIIADKYSTATRGLYKKYVDSFNQDLNDNVILIELGSTQNNYEEVNNSIDILVEAIKELLNER